MTVHGFALKGRLGAERLVARRDDDGARAFWANPGLSDTTATALAAWQRDALALDDQKWKQRAYPPQVENGLRMLIAMSPDYQTCCLGAAHACSADG